MLYVLLQGEPKKNCTLRFFGEKLKKKFFSKITYARNRLRASKNLENAFQTMKYTVGAKVLAKGTVYPRLRGKSLRQGGKSPRNINCYSARRYNNQYSLARTFAPLARTFCPLGE